MKRYPLSMERTQLIQRFDRMLDLLEAFRLIKSGTKRELNEHYPYRAGIIHPLRALLERDIVIVCSSIPPAIHSGQVLPAVKIYTTDANKTIYEYVDIIGQEQADLIAYHENPVRGYRNGIGKGGGWTWNNHHCSTLRELSKVVGIPQGTLHDRINNGWTCDADVRRKKRTSYTQESGS